MTEASITTGTRRHKLLFKCFTHDPAPVLLSGNVTELGEWNLAAAVALQPNARSQGGLEWTTQIELPLGNTVEYKFVRKSAQGPRWESGNNRRITVIPGLQTLEADFQE